MNRVLNHKFLRLLFLLALFVASVHSGFATTVIMPTDESMIIGSRAIIRGRVLAVESAFDSQTNRIYTYITVRVQEVFKGEIRTRRIVLKQEGGQLADRGTRIYGTPQFTLDENVILYLDTWADGAFRVHQMFLGKFNIVDDPNTGQQFAVRSAMDEGVVVLQNHQPEPIGEITSRLELSAYKEMLRTKIIANLEPSLALEQKYYSNIPKLAQPSEYKDLVSKGQVEPQWTYIHPAHPRWFEPDTGQPVVFRVNPAGAPNAQINNDITAAMNAWSTVPGCSMRMSVGANTDACGPDSSINTIIFNGCDGRWSAGGGGCQGVLALGGLSWGGGVSGTIVINGVTFVRGHSGFISFNPFAACNFGNSCNVQEITTHELGHALGLGHSADNSATMAAFAHFDGRCASLRPDDITGITFIYPGQGGGGGPLSITSNSPLPNATVGVPYAQTIVATGGALPYTWSVVAGSLPAGVTLNAQSGILSGTPTTAGTANFTLQVRDATQATAQKPFTITIGTAASQYDAQFVSQTVPTTLQPGQSFQINMKFNNTGTLPWVDGVTTNFYLVSQNPPLNQTWGGNGVLLSSFPTLPGQQLDLNFTATAPITPGAYNFQWQMYQNGGIGFFGQMSPNVVIQVGSAPPPVNDASFVSQTVPATMTTGQTYSIGITMQNSGTTIWTTNTFKLGSQNPQDNTTWGLNRVNLPSTVAPGGQVTFTFNVTAPSTPGTYNCQWRMLQEAVGFFGASSTNAAVTVSAPSSSSRTPFDYDGDGKADVSIWRPASGDWWILNSSTGGHWSRSWGSGIAPNNDVLVPGDYDGDGKTDLAVWRPTSGQWFIIQSSNDEIRTVNLGSQATQDIPVPGDYDGDGKTDPAVWSPGSGNWTILDSSTNTTRTANWGNGNAPFNDVPVPADYDGDDKADLAVWRKGTGEWFIINSSNGQWWSRQWGSANAPYNDVPVPADYDGDGKADVAVWRKGTGEWFIINSGNGQWWSRQWGIGSAPFNDVPVPADYDGDGKADTAIWRPGPGEWHIINSGNGQWWSRQWGTANAPFNDKVTPAAFIR
jgi:hypothetical protein